MPVRTEGVEEARMLLRELPGVIDAGLARTVEERAWSCVLRFINATPVRTGRAALAWQIEDTGPLVREVVNDVRTVQGFAYPAALVTGTGRRGVPTSGYSGAFASVPGMAPAGALHAAWEEEASTPLAYPVFFIAEAA